MRTVTRWLTALLATFGAAVAAYGLTTGPPAGYAGDPGEADCLACHGDFAMNLGGELRILGAPPLYREGATYRITVRVVSSQTAALPAPKWGFQLTAVSAVTGDGAGVFALVGGENSQITAGTTSHPTRPYVEHLAAGTRTGVRDSAEWSVDWTAPDADLGGVEFFAAGIAADGDGSGNGDFVYAASVAVADTVTPVLVSTWGSLKQRYRR